MVDTNINFLTTLENIVRQRLEDKPDDSYTAQLVSKGDKRVAQKVGEEAIELALAAAAGTRAEQLEEAADLVYHLIVLIADKGISLGEVVKVLRQRHESSKKGTSKRD